MLEAERLNNIQIHVVVFVSSVNSAVARVHAFLTENDPIPHGGHYAHEVFQCRITSSLQVKLCKKCQVLLD